MTETPALDDALRYAADHRGETLADLVELSKIYVQIPNIHIATLYPVHKYVYLNKY